MIAYKGFTKDMMSVMGNSNPETCNFLPGITMTEKDSKTGRSGYHCCDHPFGCLDYYPLVRENRFFTVLAEGDINEDGGGRIACTKITLLKELSLQEMALEEMSYMIVHPDRDGWESQRSRAKAVRDEGTCDQDGILIVRGKNPKARGEKGSILGFLVDDGDRIVMAKLITVTEPLADKWLELTEDRTVREAEIDETKAG